MTSKLLQKKRTGSAVVELAICLPLVMLLVWGAIEMSTSIFVKQTLTSAVHEGALVGTRNASTETEIQQRVVSVLNQRLEIPYELNIETATGATYNDLPSGEMFTIVVRANPKSFNDLFDLESVDARVSAIKP